MDKMTKLYWGIYGLLVALYAVLLAIIPHDPTFVFYLVTVATALVCVISGVFGAVRLRRNKKLGMQPTWPGEFTLLAIQIILFAFLDLGSVFIPKYIAIVAELIIYVPLIGIIVGEERLRDCVRWLYARRKAVTAVVVAVIIAIPVLYFAIPFARYQWAEGRLNRGEYAAAAKQFAALGDYGDADRRRQESLYALGVEMNEAGDSESAYFILSDIRGYSDVQEYLETDERLTKAWEKYSAYDDGNLVQLGQWNGEMLNWYVIDQQGSKRLLLAEKSVGLMAYNEEFEIIDWEHCSLRAWLNGEFMNGAFEAGTIARIPQTYLKNDDNAMYRVEAGDDTVDQIFLLSIDEAEVYRKKYHDWFTGYTSWLRSPGCSRIDAAVVTHGGGVDEMGSNIHHDHYSVRPVLWLDIAE